ncbi:YdcF family protein [Nodosilinea sp. E11]|uniref:YdcF family protein n=1 Tax=Nodosilinea sp. E11 TaxID=3037479 RepID=UPI002934F271|nr:YdcF family protein [Nodosilinea sp. E11]WOD37088.1 YdcF family protein [Nodosilinea sp. E11]
MSQKHHLRLALAIGSGLMAGMVAIALDIYRFGLTRDHAPADAAIVLGAAVWGEAPSPVFQERINHAIDLYQTGTVRYLIFTGGVGAQDQLAESVVASRYAIAHGVSPNHTWCETTSRITQENLQGAKQISDRQGFTRVLIVSDPLHMRRSLLMARDLGLVAYSSPTPTTRYISLKSQAPFLWRELYFYSLYLLQRPVMGLTRPAPAMQVQPCPTPQTPTSGQP